MLWIKIVPQTMIDRYVRTPEVKELDMSLS